VETKPPQIHEPEFEGHPAATEYFLPHPIIAPEHQLHPWLQSIAQAGADALREPVADRFSGLGCTPLLALQEQIISYTPYSIIVRETQQWLHLVSTHGETEQTHVLLPPSPSITELRKHLDSVPFDPGPTFSSFMRYFTGLREHFSIAGNFVEEDEEWMYLTQDWQCQIIRNFDEWRGSLLIFHAANSDQLLLHPDGHLGWWLYGVGEVERRFDSFDHFVQSYVEYRRASPWPFDAYGPPQYALRKAK
jgi:hypothetical protein